MTDTDTGSKETKGMPTSDALKRLAMIEEEIRSDREKRHDFNSAVASVIDKERVERMEMQEEIHLNFTRIDKSLGKILTLLEGSLGRGGMVSDFAKVEDRIAAMESWQAKRPASCQDLYAPIESRIKSLEEWKLNLKAYIMAGIVIAGILGGFIDVAWDFIIQ